MQTFFPGTYPEFKIHVPQHVGKSWAFYSKTKRDVIIFPEKSNWIITRRSTSETGDKSKCVCVCYKNLMYKIAVPLFTACV